MINLINNSYELVFIPHKLTVTIIWYIAGEKQRQKRYKRDTARAYFKHYRSHGFNIAGTA